MIPTRFTETCVGDMFVVRNAGNLIPHSKNYPDEVTTTEPAALELGCIVNNIRHVIVCGHSDCKVSACWVHSVARKTASLLVIIYSKILYVMRGGQCRMLLFFASRVSCSCAMGNKARKGLRYGFNLLLKDSGVCRLISGGFKLYPQGGQLFF